MNDQGYERSRSISPWWSAAALGALTAMSIALLMPPSARAFLMLPLVGFGVITGFVVAWTYNTHCM